jgi:acyl-ACP thioesterase
MHEIYTYEKDVSFDEVDQEQCLLVKAFFTLLQEAAIKHADLYGAGAHAMVERNESWVLNRMLLQISRYPKYEEHLCVKTWSTGIRSFKGYRDFRVYAGEELVAQGSSLWLYVNILRKSIIRVPAELAAAFPSHPEEAYEPGLEKMEWKGPSFETPGVEVGLRYSDIDANKHVNNTTYFEALQTALVRAKLPARPKRIGIQFLKEIHPEAESILVRLGEGADTRTFNLCTGSETHALGCLWN